MMSKTINIRIEPGLDRNDIEFIQYLESEIDRVMVENGFSRTSSTKCGGEVSFSYRQFGVCLKDVPIECKGGRGFIYDVV